MSTKAVADSTVHLLDYNTSEDSDNSLAETIGYELQETYDSETDCFTDDAESLHSWASCSTEVFPDYLETDSELDYSVIHLQCVESVETRGENDNYSKIFLVILFVCVVLFTLLFV